jgi:hypothetical protein
MTGVFGGIAGGSCFLLAQRQQAITPDSHSCEVHAAGTTVYFAITIGGMLQEIGIPQARPTPILCDSQSTIFVANDATAIKKSVWLTRRAAVLREGVDDGDVDFIKLPREHNVADYFTRPVTHQEYLHYEQYMWPQLHMAQWTAM